MKDFKIILNQNLSQVEIQNKFKDLVSSQKCSIQVQHFQIDHCKIGQNLAQLQNLVKLTIEIDEKCTLQSYLYEQISKSIEKIQTINKLNVIINEKCFIRSEGVFHICNAISNLQNLKALKFHIEKGNSITGEGYQSIKRMLEIQRGLEKLSIILVEDNSAKPENVIEMLVGLQQQGSLKELNLKISLSQFSEESSIALGLSLKKLLQLHTLNILIELSYGGLIEESFAQSIGQLKALQKLDFNIISPLPLRSNIVKEFINSFKNLPDLQEFRTEGLLSDQQYQNQIDFSSILRHTINMKILTLDFDYRNKNSDQIFNDFGDNISYLNRLECLSITIHPQTIQSNIGLSNLLDSINSKRDLQKLKISIKENNLIYSNCEFQLKQIIQDLINLKCLELYFGEETISANGAYLISQSLKFQSQLENLTLTIISNRNHFLGTVVTSLQYLTNLKSLYLDFSENISNSAFYRDPQDNEYLELFNRNLLFSLKNLRNMKSFYYNKKLQLIQDFDLLQYTTQVKQLYCQIEKQDYLSKMSLEEFIKYQKVLNEARQLDIVISNFQNNNNENFPNVINLQDFKLICENLKIIQELQISINCQSYKYNTVELHLRTISRLTNLLDLRLIILHSMKFNLSYSEMFQGLQNLKTLFLSITLGEAINQQSNLCLDLETGLSYLTNLKSLKLQIQYHYQETTQIKYGKCIKNLINLEKFSIRLFKKLEQEYQEDLLQGILHLKNLRFLTIDNQYQDSFNLNFIFKLQQLTYLQELSLKSPKYSDQFSYFKREKKQKKIQKQQPNKEIKSEFFDQNLNLNHLQVLEVVFQKKKDFNLSNLEFVLSQFRQIQNLNKLSLMIESKNSSSLSNNIIPLQNINITNEENYQIGLIQQNSSQLKEFKLIIKNVLFTDSHALLIGQEMHLMKNLELLHIKITQISSLSLKGILYLFENIQYLESLIDLNINIVVNPNINDEIANPLFEYLKYLPLLKNLKIDLTLNQSITNENITNLTQSLSKLKKLQVLDLSLDNNQSGQSIEEDQLFYCLSNLKNLQKINIKLCQNQIIKNFIDTNYYGSYYKLRQNCSLKSSQCIQYIMSSLANLNYLQNINFQISSENQLQQEQIQQFGEFINQYKNQITIKFDLSQLFKNQDIQENILEEKYQLNIQNMEFATQLMESINLEIQYQAEFMINFNDRFGFQQKKNYLELKKGINQINIFQLLSFPIEGQNEDRRIQSENVFSDFCIYLKSMKYLKNLKIQLFIDTQLENNQVLQFRQFLTQLLNLVQLRLDIQLSTQEISNQFINNIQSNLQNLKKLRQLSFNYQQENRPKNQKQIKQHFMRKFKYLILLTVLGKQNEILDVD